MCVADFFRYRYLPTLWLSNQNLILKPAFQFLSANEFWFILGSKDSEDSRIHAVCRIYCFATH